MATNLIKIFIRYSKISISLLKQSYIIGLQYRFHFYIRLLRIAFETAIVIIFINTLFHQTDSIAGWNSHSMLLIYAMFVTTSGLAYVFLSDNPLRLSEKILQGDLDLIITKPVNPYFLTFTRTMGPHQIWRIIPAIAIIMYVLPLLHHEFSLINVFLFLTNFIAASLITFALITFIATLSFWTYSYELVALTQTVTGIARHPLNIFNPHITRVFTIIPLIFISTIPTLTLIGRVNLLSYLALPLSLIFLFLSYKFFNYALTKYSSASS